MLRNFFVPIEPEHEPIIKDIEFTIHKFNKRVKPVNPKNTIVYPCFSEFGTEVLGTLYCIPMMNRRFPGKYRLAMGWKGRTFLYKDIVDEFWEIDEKHMWLRKYCRAFMHFSRNLSFIERNARSYGQIVTTLSNTATYPKLTHCHCGGAITQTYEFQICPKCGIYYPASGIFNEPLKYKSLARFPTISIKKKEMMARYVKPNSIGITARNRDAYGRNLPISFYEDLIRLVRKLGYDPIWLGEKQSILPCPVKDVTDFTVTEHALDLENTLALVSQLRFTLQYWTASTRLAGLVGTPFIVFESPDQIYGGNCTPGHEGFRMLLCSKGPKKVVLAHYNSVVNNLDKALSVTEQAIHEIEENNFNDIPAFVADREYWNYGTIHKASC